MKELLAQYTKLKASLDRREKGIEKLKKEFQLVKDQLLAEFRESSTQSVKTNGLTIYIKQGMYASLNLHNEENKDVEYKRAVQVLKSHGYSNLVAEKFDVRSVMKTIKDDFFSEDSLFEDNVKSLPEDIKTSFKFSDVYTIESRKSSGKKQPKVKGGK